MAYELGTNPSNRTAVGVRIFEGATVAATVAASFLGTFALHDGDGDHMWRLDFDGFEHFDHTSTVMDPVGPGHVEYSSITVTVDGEPRVETDTHHEFAKAPYAREYAADIQSEQVDETVAASINETVANYRADGWSNIRVQVYGVASPEDDLTLADAGIQTENADNQALADKRATVFVEHLQADLPADIPIEKIDGIEAIATDQQAADLADMAEQFGYADISDMFYAWNIDHSAPPSVAAMLEAWFGPDRGVNVTVIADRAVTGPDGTEVTEQAVCVVPVKQITVTHNKIDHDRLPIPKFAIIPLPVFRLFIRRRQKPAPAHIRSSATGAAAPIQASSAARSWTTAEGIGLGLAGGGSGAGGPGMTEDDTPVPVTVGPEPTPQPVPPKQPIESSPPPPKRPRKRILPKGCLTRMIKIGLPVGLAIGLSAWGLKSCDIDLMPDNDKPSTTPTTNPGEPCTPGMPQEQEVVDTGTKIVLDR